MWFALSEYRLIECQLPRKALQFIDLARLAGHDRGKHAGILLQATIHYTNLSKRISDTLYDCPVADVATQGSEQRLAQLND